MPMGHVRLHYHNHKNNRGGEEKRKALKRTHHRPNVRVWYCIKLFKSELIIMPDVDVSAPVLC
jgi:hypothetical protein